MADPRGGRRRVAVTGVGVISSVGIGVEEFVTSIRAGRHGMSRITGFPVDAFPKVIGGEVQDFDPGTVLERLDQRRWGRSGTFAASAARLAVRDADLDPDLLTRAAAGSVFGTTSGESAVTQQLAETWIGQGIEMLEAERIPMAPAHRVANAVNAELGLTGMAQTIATACSASNYALGYAFDAVATGIADIMIAGGADAVNRHTHAGFLRLGALSDDVIRPFHSERSGIITGEGGVALLLEPLADAVRRGAPVYAEMLGYGVGCDAVHMVHPDRDGLARCMRLAHDQAGVKPEEIDYICAHGTGTPANDEAEIGAVRDVFGATIPPISSIKSMLGHTMGAASGFGAAISCAALREGFLPPTAHLDRPDPALGDGLDFVAGVSRSATLRVVQNNGFAFGGNNAVTLLGRVA